MPDLLGVATKRKRRLSGGDKRAIRRVSLDTADAFTLFEHLEAKLEQYPGQLTRASVELAILIQDIQELESRAHRLGLLVTARALNQAKNALGWEIAGDIVMAGKAARGVGR